MKIKTFRDAELFDEYLAEFQKRQNAPISAHIKMVDVFDSLRGISDSGRLFGFMTDLFFQVALLNIDLCKMGDLDREAIKYNILAGLDPFCNRAELLKANSDYIFRYRAIWDKVMSILVLIFKPDRFQQFAGSKSRKRSFLRIMKEENNVPDQLLQSIDRTITDFDELYRTKEIHGSGSAWKWSFDQTESPFSDQSNMYWAWNSLNGVLAQIGNMFRYISKQKA